MSKLLGKVKSLPPSLFDVAFYIYTLVIPIFFLKPWNLNMAQGWAFVFGTFALYGVSFFCKEERQINDKPLGAIILWSLACLLIHTFDVSLSGTYAQKFINFALLSEGFIYVFCGILLGYLVSKFTRNYNISYPIIVINVLNLFFVIVQKLNIPFIWTNIYQACQVNICGMMGTKSQLAVFSAISIPILFNFSRRWIWLAIIPAVNMALSNSYSGPVALFCAYAFYFFITKNYPRLIVWLVLGISLSGLVQWHKFLIRPPLWWLTIKDIIQHPFIGWGFDNSLGQNKIWFKYSGIQSLSFRHNDYLNIARDLGLPFLAMILFQVKKCLTKVKKDYVWMALVILAIAIFAQHNFYYPRIAIWGIVLLALKRREQYASGTTYKSLR